MGARTLDARFFDLLERRVEGDFEFQAYRTVHPSSTMVLFSRTHANTPVAALSFLPRATGTNAKTVITRRDCAPPGAHGNGGGCAFFQGLSNVDNDEFSLGIHNLTDFVRDPHVAIHNADKTQIGYLKIDVLGHERAYDVREVDMPTLSVNQVNELRPSESYLIESDQRTGNRTMVLRGAVDAATGRRVTVQQDERAAQCALNERTQGTYFYVSVVASANFPAMVDVLRATTWRAVDVFVRRIPKNHGAPPPLPSPYSASRRLMCGSGATAARAPWSMQGGGAQAASSFVSKGGTTAATISRARGAPSLSLDWNDEACYATTTTTTTTMSMNSNGVQVSATPTRDEVQSSQAGQVVQGSQHVHVQTGWTGQEYAYDVRGERVCLGLSVWRDMRLLEALTPAEARDEAEMQLEDAVAEAGRGMLDLLSTVFKADECTVCLENAPDIIFFQCGHQCLCHECATGSVQARQEKRCYMCRAPIVARIPASAMSASA